MSATASATALIMMSALGYAGATVVMARFSSNYAPVLVAIIGMALLLAVLAEIAALRHLPISIVYLMILGLETLLILVAATWFGQSLGTAELLGAAMILTGTVLLAFSHG